MGTSNLYISALCTVVSLVGLQWWTEIQLHQLKLDDSVGKNVIHSGNTGHLLGLILGSHVTVVLLANFVLNIFVLGILCLKTIFFVQLHQSEVRKVVERLINYVIFKGAFLPLVVPQTLFQAGMWSTWLIVICSLKMFEALARDRLERLNASPSATPWTYVRVFLVLLLVLSIDFFWINLCIKIYITWNSAVFLLLFFEPLSIAFETLQAIMVHGFQLLDIWHRHSMERSIDGQRSCLFNRSAAGSLWEWKGILTRNFGFFLDMMTLLMALGHYLYMWWIRGMAFHLVEPFLFLTIRALATATYNRIKGFVNLKKALSALNKVLPDATSAEIEAYDDECAICKDPMAKAKKLSCGHLFHLACLQSWLDQGLTKIYSCPTCRRPLFVVRPEENTNPHTEDSVENEQLARQISSGLEQQNTSGHSLPVEAFSNVQQNSLESLPARPSQGFDGGGVFTALRSAGLGRVQMMMRHLASLGSPVSSVPATGGLSFSSTSLSADDNISSINVMADMVREVLPHIPDEIISQDLRRTNSVVVTVNNLLQM